MTSIKWYLGRNYFVSKITTLHYSAIAGSQNSQKQILLYFFNDLSGPINQNIFKN